MPVLAERTSHEQRNGQPLAVRQRIVRDEQAKYPLLRLVDELTGTPNGPLVQNRTISVADHVVIKPVDPKMDVESFLKKLGQPGIKVRARKPASGIWLLSFPKAELDTVTNAIRNLSGQAGLIKYAEPDYVVQTAAQPDDSSFSQLWGMHNTGQTGGVTDADIDAPEAWNLSTGSSSLLVGIIDTGLQYTHPDIAPNAWTNPNEIDGNNIDDDNNGYVDDVRGWNFINETNDPMDDNSHGTHCAGTIGGAGNNALGVAGVCWNVKLAGLKFLNANGSGYISDATEATAYATSIGVTLTSNSWGGGGFSQAMMDAISEAGNAGILFVAAAGNSYANTDLGSYYPQGYDLPNVISVAATDASDKKAAFSNYGLLSVDLGAPGVAIYSTVPAGSYKSYSGTSMAAPHVAGACALLKSYRPTLSHLEVKEIIINSGDPIPALEGLTVSGRRLNVYNALTRGSDIIVSPTTPLVTSRALDQPATPASRTYTIGYHGSATTSWTASTNVPWVDLSATGGTLEPNQQSQVTASINAAASSLPAGTHTGTITFRNTASGLTITCDAVVRVTLPPRLFFSETFETGTLRSFWQTSGTGPFRIQPTTSVPAHGGLWCVSLDSTAASFYARNELTLSQNLTGRDHVRLTFWMRRSSDTSDYALPGPYQGSVNADCVSFSTDGGTTWYPLMNISDTTSEWKSYAFDLDNLFASSKLAYGPGFKVRFNRYSLNTTATAFDDIELVETGDPVIKLALPAVVNEGAGTINGTLTLSPPSPTSMVVNLVSSDPSELTLGASITVPAGTATVPLTATVLNDGALSGTQAVAVTASTPGYGSGTTTIKVTDLSTATLSIVLPSSITEGDHEISGTVSMSQAAGKAVSVELAASDEAISPLPPAVIIPAGETSSSFSFGVTDDLLLNGARPVIVTAQVTGWAGGSATTTILDNEGSALSVELPASVSETAGTIAAAGIVRLPGRMQEAVTVTLVSDSPGRVSVPASVVIPAGADFATFALTVQDDALSDGSHSALITATAPGLSPGSSNVSVLDDDGAPLVFNPSPAHLASQVQVDADLAWEAAQGNLVKNGDFESGLLSSWVVVADETSAVLINKGTTDSPGPDSAVPPFSGSASLCMGTGSVGMASVYQDVAVPLDGPEPVLQWTQRLNLSNAAYSSFKVEARDPAGGSSPQILFATATTDPAITDWAVQSANLRSWRGRTVRLTFTAQTASTSSVTAHLDNVQLMSGTRGTQYEVYFNTSLVLSTPQLLAVTSARTWALPRLAPGTYYWKVVARQGSVVAQGPVWQFTVPVPSAVDRYEWSAIASPQYSHSAITATLTARDAGGSVATGASGTLDLQALLPGIAQPPVVISEVSMRSPHSIEFTSVSNQKTDVSGWQISLYNSTNWPVPAARFVVPEGAELAPGDTFRLIGSSIYSTSFPFCYFSQALFWSPSSKVAVLLRNRSGEIVDFMCSNAPPAQITQPVAIPAGQWLGPPLSGFDASLSASSFQRVGSFDTHGPGDWIVDLSTLDVVNPRLTLPFSGGRVPAVPGLSIGQVSLTGGTWTGTLSIAPDDPVQTVRLRATDSTGRRADSNSFDVIQPRGSLTLTTASSITEGNGTVSAFGTVWLPSAASSNTTVSFAIKDGDSRLSVPSITIPFGALSMPFSFTIANDALINGTKTISLEARAAGYRAAARTVVVHDNDTGTVSISAPAAVTEGDGTLLAAVTISSSAATDSGTQVALSSSDPTELVVPDLVTFPAGQNSVTVPLTVIDDGAGDGPQTATLTATIAGLAPATSSPISIADRGAQPLSVTLPASSTDEGAGELPGTGRVTLPGTAVAAVTVTLASSDPQLVTVPATVTVPAGSSSAAFKLMVLDNSQASGSPVINVTATASGYQAGSQDLVVRDNEVHHFNFSHVGTQRAKTPFQVIITARRLDDTLLSSFRSSVNLTAVNASLVSTPFAPAFSGQFSAGAWIGQMTVDTLENGVTLIAAVAGASGSSNGFDVTAGPPHHFEWSALPASVGINSPFSATVTAKDSKGFTATGWSGSAHLRVTRPDQMFSTGTPTGASNIPLPLAGSCSGRTELIYLPAQMGRARRLAGVALALSQSTAFSGQWTVRLQHSTRASYLPAFDVFESGSWTEVYSGPAPASGGWMTFPFSRVFDYNGSSSLIVQLTYRGASRLNSIGQCAVETTAPVLRAAYNWTNSSDVDPDLWLVPSQTTSSLPVLRFDESVDDAPIMTTGAFTQGVWSGNVRVPVSGSGVSLTADEVSGSARGVSGTFNVSAPFGTLAMSLPATIDEGSATSGTLTLTPTRATDLTIHLVPLPADRLTLPATLVIPANTSSVPIPVSISDDSALQGDLTVSVEAYASGTSSSFASLLTTDNEFGGSLALASPVTALEGSPALSATITLPSTTTTSRVISLTSSDTTELTVPSSVTIPAGSKSANFNIDVVDDSARDGAQSVRITASCPGCTDAVRSISVQDNDLDHFYISTIASPQLPGTSFPVTISARTTDDQLVTDFTGAVTFSALNGAGSSVAITPASSPAFAQGIWNGLLAISTPATGVLITASDGAGHIGTSQSFNVGGDRLDSFEFNPIQTSKFTGQPFNISIKAVDRTKGGTYAGYTGTPALQALQIRTEATAGPGLTVQPGGSYTFASRYRAARYQCVYVPADVGPARPLTAIGIRFYIRPNQVMKNFRFRVKHTTKSTLTGWAWENTGWTVVHQSNLSITEAGWCKILFDTPFDYDGTSNLMIDMQFVNDASDPVANQDQIMENFVAPVYRSAGFLSNTPVNLENPSYCVTFAESARFKFYSETPLPMTPAAAAGFASGTWTGAVTINKPATDVVLRATDPATGASGDSVPFQVFSHGPLVISLGSVADENSPPLNGTVTLPAVSSQPVVVQLSSTVPGRAAVTPASITVPAGEISAAFQVAPADDNLANGAAVVSIAAAASGYQPAAQTLTVNDNDAGVLTLTLPSRLQEGSTPVELGTASIPAPLASPQTIVLVSTDTTELTVPATVVIPAGQTSATFGVTVINDTLLDGQQSFPVLATLTGWPTASAIATVLDNEAVSVSLSSTVMENASALTGTVSIPTARTSPFPVVITSSAPSRLAVTTASVTIPAGSTSASFTVTPVDNSLRDGGADVLLSFASTGFTTAARSIHVTDNEIAAFKFATISNPQIAGVNFSVSVSARDKDDGLITNFSGSAALAALSSSGPVTLPLNSISLNGGVGSVQISVASPVDALLLTASNSEISTASNTFKVSGSEPLASFAFSGLPSTAAAGTPFNASITARTSRGTTATGYSGLATLAATIPASDWTMAAGTGTWTFPFNAGYIGGARTQAIYLPSEVGGAKRLTGLSFNVTTSSTSNFGGVTIRLKHSPVSMYLSGQARWESSGWTTVYAGTPAFNATGWKNLPFSAPFDYNGLDPLMVDVSFIYASGGPVSVSATTVTDSRVYYLGAITDTIGAPSQWSGTSPVGNMGTNRVDLRFNTASTTLLTPVSASFTNGLWSGPVTLFDTGSATTLTASDPATGAQGTSAAINVTASTPLTVSLPASLNEGGTPGSGTVSIAATEASDLQITLSAFEAGMVTVPAFVTIPAGSTSATFDISAVNNSLLQGQRNVVVSALAPAHSRGTATCTINDNDGGSLAVIFPSIVTEGTETTVTGTLKLSQPAPGPLVVSLVSSNPSRLSLPATVAFPAGQESLSVTATITNDAAATGPTAVSITASAPFWTGDTTAITINDDEHLKLSISSAVLSVTEASTSSATIFIATVQATPLVISLSSSDTSVFTVPATATIAAGSLNTTITLTAPDNASATGARQAVLTASASGYPGAVAFVKAVDNDISRYEVDPVAGPKLSGVAFQATINCKDALGGTAAFSAARSFSVQAASPSGAVGISPTSINSATGSFITVSLTIASPASNVMLTFTDLTTGVKAISNPFDVAAPRQPNQYGWSGSLAGVAAGTPFSASLLALSGSGGTLNTYQGSASLSAASGVTETISGTGTFSTSHPLGASLPQSRSQYIYLPSEVGPAGWITGISLNVGTLPVTALNSFVVRLKHTTKASYSGTGNGVWETSGWTLCCQRKALQISTNGWNRIRFAQPFYYDGTSNLMLDFIFDNSLSSITNTSGTQVKSTVPAAGSRVLQTSVSFSTPPLEWSGTNPFGSTSSSMPNIRFTKSVSAAVVSPASTASFSSGAWTGSLSLQAPATGVMLTAIDEVADLQGESALFDVAAAAPVFAAKPAFTGGTTSPVSWAPVFAATGYEVQVSTNPGFSSSATSGIITGTNHTFPGMIHGQVYFYRSRALAVVNSAWSPTWTSTQDSTPPSLGRITPADCFTDQPAITLRGTASDPLSGVLDVVAGSYAASTSNGYAAWDTSVTGLAGGSNSITVTARDKAAPPNATTEIWTVYRIENPNAATDGVSNFLRAAFSMPAGQNPMGRLPAAQPQVNPGDGKRYLMLTYHRRIQRAGFVYSVETSTNMGQWSPFNADIHEVGAAPSGDGITEVVTVRVLPALKDSSGKFVRLRVALE